MSALPHVWVDADSCPFKEEIIAISKRFGLEITFVSNTPIKSLEGRKGISNLVSGNEFDAVDDLIVEQSQAPDLAITKDLMLAKRLKEKGLLVCGLQGKAYGADLGDAIAHRNLHTMIREEQGGFEYSPSKSKKGHKNEKISAFKNNFHNFLSNSIKLQ